MVNPAGAGAVPDPPASAPGAESEAAIAAEQPAIRANVDAVCRNNLCGDLWGRALRAVGWRAVTRLLPETEGARRKRMAAGIAGPLHVGLSDAALQFVQIRRYP